MSRRPHAVLGRHARGPPGPIRCARGQTRPCEEPQRSGARPGARRSDRGGMLLPRAKKSWARSPSCSTTTPATCREKLDGIQHDYFEQIVTCMHVHLDRAHLHGSHHSARRKRALCQAIANLILGTKGVTHGHLTMTTTGHGPYTNQGEKAARAWAHEHPHAPASSPLYPAH